MATIQAVKVVYPSVKVTGCYFHYWKAVLNKSQTIGFNKIEQGIFITRLYMQLPLLPPLLIPEALLSIQEVANDSEEYNAFSNYFSNQWMGIYTENVLSCYKENFRTNNPVEGWHGRLKKKISSQATIVSFFTIIKERSSLQDIKIKKRTNSLQRKAAQLKIDRKK